MTTVNLSDGTRFDFKSEAEMAAVNEACAGDIAACTREDMCVFCKALAHAIEGRLIRAFIAGQKSMAVREGASDTDTGPDIPGGGAV